jgi:diguanylate cyclase (GGDEF)-like protein
MGRKRIGLQTARLESGYGVNIWKGAMSCAEKLDADLLVFPGRNLKAPHDFSYQYNRIFQLMSGHNLDALILVTTLISNYIDEGEFLEFCSRFRDIPLISIGLKIPGVPSIVIDNRSGIRALVRHMIEEHGARRVAFVRGPAGNWEANERFLAYREELELHGIEFDERLVALGDFTPFGVGPAVESLLGRNEKAPDAFLFANDEMAIKGMRILRDKGFDIPCEAAVAGFDDIAEASTQPVPLTTIRQPLFEMGWQACVMAGDLVDGKRAPELTVLPAEPIIRSSCGCFVHCVDDMRTLKTLVAKECAETGAAPAPGEGGRSDCFSRLMFALREGKFDKLYRVDLRRDSVREVLDALVDLCVLARPEGGEEERFLSRFGAILGEEAGAEMRPGDWLFILPALAASIEGVHGGATDPRRLEAILSPCMALSAEMGLIRQNAVNFEESSVNHALREVQYGLSPIMLMEDLATTLKDALPRLGVDTFFVSVFEKEWSHGLDSPWSVPERLRFVVGMVDGLELGAPDEEVYSSMLLLPPGLVEGGGRRTLVAYPLFFRDMHYGTIVYEMRHQNGFVYESLTTQISGILKAIALYRAKENAENSLRQALAELEKFNQQLSDLSLTDELTGLYNRRGFMKLASQQLSLTRQMDKKALLIYGDLDGLKRINDNYGHEEGDFAIKAVAVIVKRVFRSMDVISRIGGDEFTILASNTNEKGLAFFQSRMSELLEELNASSGKPYKISISLGCSECLPGSDRTLEEYMREADAKLYVQKIAKRGAKRIS